MLEVAPFCAIRYEASRLGGDLSAVLAPPYDVLDQSDKDRLLRGSDRNIVAVDLPHLPCKSKGPAGVYEQSATRLAGWLDDATLRRDPQPAFYVYHQQFELGGKSVTRRMFIARVGLQEFSAGVILPHEQTFGGPKEDRLALMKATRCNLSPIFGLFADAGDKVASVFAGAASSPPTARGVVDGVESRLWMVTDAAAVSRVTALMADRRIYIADGHHRYGTALTYREGLAEQHGGSLPADHPANYVMFVLASMDDPGCVILPYYRVLCGIGLDALLSAWGDGVAPAIGGAAIDLVLHEGATGRQAAVRFTRREILAALAPQECPAWHKLDSAYLHRYLLDELLAKAQGKPAAVHYVKSREDALSAARTESGTALLVNATTMAQLRAVAESRGLMPPKSTYFHPKLATGMTIYPLT